MTRDGKSAIVPLSRATRVAFIEPTSRKVKSYVLVGIGIKRSRRAISGNEHRVHASRKLVAIAYVHNKSVSTTALVTPQ
jgi:hypothetical protein